MTSYSNIAEEHAPDVQPTTPGVLLALLDELNISYTLYRHKAVFSVEGSDKIKEKIIGEGCRNLFLSDKKKRMFLVVAANTTPVDLKYLEKSLPSGRLSFGSSNRLWMYLGVILCMM